MKPEGSAILHQKYFSLSNKLIEITLRDGQVITCTIAGFFRDPDNQEQIIEWHIVPQTLQNTAEDIFNTATGQTIKHSQIRQVVFREDNSMMFFT
ncbi:MAG TPA: hypothetical protein VK177_18010 [Flavobacteriales bacterium]|nr:hypothetical protein [Flavobacteriales bacterium]